MGQAAVEGGATGVWLNDHLLMQSSVIDDYPYSADGRITWDASEDYFEALTTCSYLAGTLKGDLTIGPAVLVLPQRNVLQVAKELATIDRLSGGRLRVGVGIGWNAYEMEALGYRFATRARRFEEMLTVLKNCWSGSPDGFDGREIRVPESVLLRPFPMSDSGPPIIVGGMAPAAVLRAAKYGDGWMALGFVERWEEENLRSKLSLFRQAWSDSRRQGQPICILKLHCGSDAFGLLGRRVSEAESLLFDEVAIDLPWHLGINEAIAFLNNLH